MTIPLRCLNRSSFVYAVLGCSLVLLTSCIAGTGLVSSLGVIAGRGGPTLPTEAIDTLFMSNDPQLQLEKYCGVKRETVDGIVWRYQGNVLGSTKGMFSSEPEMMKGDIAIPETLDGVTIVAIGPHYFMQCTNLTSVTVPDSIRSIGEMAFSQCESLASVHLSHNLASIGAHAFSGCKSLESVQIPPAVQSVGEGAFCHCKMLAVIDLPQNVVHIGKGAFQGCSGLASVAIPKGVKVLEDNTFSGCFGLVAVSLPEGLVRIGDSAFHSPLPSQNCADIRAVKLPSTLVTIGESAFSGCSGLTKIVIPDNVTTIGNYAFNDCSSLKTTYIGKKVARLGTGAFRHTGLTHVYVADGASVTLDDLHRAGIAEDCEVYRIYPDRRTERL